MHSLKCSVGLYDSTVYSAQSFRTLGRRLTQHHLRPSSHHLTSHTSPELASIYFPEQFER
jgi:hypothetical protein